MSFFSGIFGGNKPAPNPASAAPSVPAHSASARVATPTAAGSAGSAGSVGSAGSAGASGAGSRAVAGNNSRVAAPPARPHSDAAYATVRSVVGNGSPLAPAVPVVPAVPVRPIGRLQQPQQPQQPPAVPQTSPMTIGGGGSGGVDFDMFGGLNLKVDQPAAPVIPAVSLTPTSISTTVPVASSSSTTSHFFSNSASLSTKQQPVLVQATLQSQVQPPAPPAAPPSFSPESGRDSLFDGLDISRNDPAVSLDAPAPGSASASLLSMIQQDSTHPSEPGGVSDEAGVSGAFSFISEETSATTDNKQENQTEGRAGGFSFIGESEQVVSAVTPAAAAMLHVSSPSLEIKILSVATSSRAASASQSPPISAPDSSNAKSPTMNTLHSVRSHFESSLSAYWSKWKQLNETCSTLRHKQVEARRVIRDSASQLKESEEKQSQAVMNEEYEKADQLNSIIETIKKQVQLKEKETAEIEKLQQQKEKEKASAIETILNLLNSMNTKLYELKSTRVNEMTSYIKTQSSILEKKEDQLNSDYDRVHRILTHTRSDLSDVEKEESEIETSIANDTKEFNQEKEELQQQQITLELELEALLKQVELKKQEISTCKQKQEITITKIASVRSSHEKKLKRINEKKDRIHHEKDLAENEEKKLDQQRKQLDDSLVQMKQKESEYKDGLSEINDAITAATQVNARVKKEEEQRIQWGESHQQLQAKLQLFREELASISTATANLHASLRQLESCVETHHRNIATINQRIPSLETEKNIAVKVDRDFKKAAAVNKEIKDMQKSKQESETAIEESKGEVKQKTQEMEEWNAKKAEVEDKIRGIEKEGDEKRLKWLLKHQRALQSRKRKLERFLDRSSGSLLEHVHRELDAISPELQFLEVEMKELRSEHGWKEGDVVLGPGEYESEVEEDEQKSENAKLKMQPSAFDQISKQPRSPLPLVDTQTPASPPSQSISPSSSQSSSSSSSSLSPSAARTLSASSSSSSTLASLSTPKIGTTVISAPSSPSSKTIEMAPAVPATPAAVPPQFTEEDLAEARQAQGELTGAVSQLEAQLGEAILAEEYEQAAELEDQIKDKKTEIEHLDATIAKIVKAIGISTSLSSDGTGHSFNTNTNTNIRPPSSPSAPPLSSASPSSPSSFPASLCPPAPFKSSSPLSGPASTVSINTSAPSSSGESLPSPSEGIFSPVAEERTEADTFEDPVHKKPAEEIQQQDAVGQANGNGDLTDGNDAIGGSAEANSLLASLNSGDLIVAQPHRLGDPAQQQGNGDSTSPTIAEGTKAVSSSSVFGFVDNSANEPAFDEF